MLGSVQSSPNSLLHLFNYYLLGDILLALPPDVLHLLTQFNIVREELEAQRHQSVAALHPPLAVSLLLR